MKCPTDGEELQFIITMDEGDGDTLFAIPYYRCLKCQLVIHDYDDEFEYPDNYDELVEDVRH